MAKAKYEITTRCRFCGELITVINIYSKGYKGFPKYIEALDNPSIFLIGPDSKAKHKCTEDGSFILSDLVKVKELEEIDELVKEETDNEGD